MLEHRWTMFVTLNDSTAETKKFIKTVTYHLHPTYAVNKFKLKEAPFLLSRVAWGYFEIEVDIEFQDWTRLNTLKLYHMLSFDGKGST